MIYAYEQIVLKQKELVVGGKRSGVTLWVPPTNLMRTYLVFAARLDPPTDMHYRILEALVRMAEHYSLLHNVGRWQVVVWPHEAYGTKEVQAPPEVRKGWMEKLPGHVLRIDDLERTDGDFTPRWVMQEIFERTKLVVNTGLTDEPLYVPSTVLHVIGEDNVLAMGDWAEAEYLWHDCQWLIVPRPGAVVSEHPPHHVMLSERFFAPEARSATQVRDMIRAGVPGWEQYLAPMSDLVDDIKRLGLYGYHE